MYFPAGVKGRVSWTEYLRMSLHKVSHLAILLYEETAKHEHIYILKLPYNSTAFTTAFWLERLHFIAPRCCGISLTRIISALHWLVSLLQYKSVFHHKDKKSSLTMRFGTCKVVACSCTRKGPLEVEVAAKADGCRQRTENFTENFVTFPQRRRWGATHESKKIWWAGIGNGYGYHERKYCRENRHPVQYSNYSTACYVSLRVNAILQTCRSLRVACAGCINYLAVEQGR